MVATALTGTGNATTAIATTATASLTVPIPANTVVGDVLIATFASDYNGPVTTATPGWVRVSPAKAGSMREVAIWHAFTADGIPAAPVFTQIGNARATATMFRVTGASQTERTIGTGVYPATADTANTNGMTIPSTGATGQGITFAVAYNNAAGPATAAAGNPTIDGVAPKFFLTSFGSGSLAAGSSSTSSIVTFSTVPGPFVVDWGKTIANSYGVAVTIPASGEGGGPVTPEPEPEPEHEDEPNVAIQIGPGNVTTAAANETGINSIRLPVPTRAKPGDVLLAAIAHSSTSALTFPNGWVLLSKPRAGDNRWLAVYGYILSSPQIPESVIFTSTNETDLRISGVMMRLTGVGADYLAGISDWQTTAPTANAQGFTLGSPSTSGTAGIAVVYSNSTTGAAVAQAAVSDSTLVGRAGVTAPDRATTAIEVWRTNGNGPKTVTFAPRAANASGFQLSFQSPRPVVPASWEAKYFKGGRLQDAQIAAVKSGGQFMRPSLVNWSPKDYNIDDLMSTTPFFLAHRGSGDNWPEHTMESYTNAAAHGVKALEVSVSLTADNILICHHDLNFKKTAGDERTLRSMTYQQILDEIRIDTRQWTGSGTPLTVPPLAKDVIDAYIDTHVIFIEDKGGDGANALLNLMDTYPRGKEKFVWKQWAGAGQWQAAKDRGYKLWGYFMPDIFARIPELAPNFDYLGVPHTASDQVVLEVVNIAKQRNQPVIMWEIHYRHMMDRALSLGVRGMMTSNIPYVMTAQGTPQFTRDQFSTGLRTAGDLPHTTDGGWAVQPVIDGPNAVVRFVTNPSTSYSMGSMAPIPWSRYSIEWEMRWPDALPTSALHSGIYFGKTTDTTHRTGVNPTEGGYHLIQRVNGLFDLYRHDPGATGGIPLASGTAPLPKVGEWMKFRVEVTPETLTAKRIVNGQTVLTLGSGDNSYRGGYFGLQKNYAIPTAEAPISLEYRNVMIAPL